MPFEFKKKAKKGAGSGLDDRDMAQRIQQENERFKDATDSEYWTCLCFRTEADRDRFCELTGTPNRRFVTGEELREAVSEFKPDKRKRGFPRIPKGSERVPSPLASVDYSQDLERSSYDEAMTLKAALMAARGPERCRESTDSDVWICAVFQNREDGEAFLTDWNLHKHGDKYLDATAWLKEIEGMR